MAHTEQVLFLASTNLPWTLDPALLRRFQQIIDVDLPNFDQRVSILRNRLTAFNGNKSASAEADLKDLASRTEGFSGSDLDRGCSMAIQKVLRRRVKMKEANSGNNVTTTATAAARTAKNGGKGRRQSSVDADANVDADGDRPKLLLGRDLSECLEKVRPLNESWRRKYEKWKFGNEARNSKT